MILAEYARGEKLIYCLTTSNLFAIADFSPANLYVLVKFTLFMLLLNGKVELYSPVSGLCMVSDAVSSVFFS